VRTGQQLRGMIIDVAADLRERKCFELIAPAENPDAVSRHFHPFTLRDTDDFESFLYDVIREFEKRGVAWPLGQSINHN